MLKWNSADSITLTLLFILNGFLNIPGAPIPKPEDDLDETKKSDPNVNGEPDSKLTTRQQNNAALEVKNSNAESVTQNEAALRNRNRFMESEEVFEEHMRHSYNVLPIEQKLGALQAHGQWYGRVKELKSALKNVQTLLRKTAVFSYMRLFFEIYEWLFSVSHKKNITVLETLTKEEIEAISLLFIVDQTIKRSLIVHFDQWYAILTYSTDEKIIKFKKETMAELGFKDDRTLAKYIAISYCMLSNVGQNFPKGIINYESEDDVIAALKEWEINDDMILNAIRAIYRLSHTTT